MRFPFCYLRIAVNLGQPYASRVLRVSCSESGLKFSRTTSSTSTTNRISSTSTCLDTGT